MQLQIKDTRSQYDCDNSQSNCVQRRVGENDTRNKQSLALLRYIGLPLIIILLGFSCPTHDTGLLEEHRRNNSGIAIEERSNSSYSDGSATVNLKVINDSYIKRRVRVECTFTPMTGDNICQDYILNIEQYQWKIITFNSGIRSRWRIGVKCNVEEFHGIESCLP